jgi:hypothetical protein
MTAKDATFVFLVISWGEDGRDGDVAFGPFVAEDDYSHLREIEGFAKIWRDENPDKPNVAVHLFATLSEPAVAKKGRTSA